jgi:NAD(P)-dependent dehydrogenase (short-subunit alcohol dehydrogenase family)
VTGIFGKGAQLDPSEADEHADAVRPALEELLPTFQPLRRIGTADDVAHAALFLASDASAMVNGHNLVVDGGAVAGRPHSTMIESLRVLSKALRPPRPAAARGQLS